MRVRGAARPGCAGAKQASPAFAACGGGAAPRTLPLQKRCKGSRGRPAEPGKIRQFILSKYYNAAAPEKQRNRRFCNRIVKMPARRPRKIPTPAAAHKIRNHPPPCAAAPPFAKASPRHRPTPQKNWQFAPGALSRYNNAAKRKILRIRREPTPPPANPSKKSRQFVSGALSRYNSAAKTERPAARPPAKRSRGEKSPHPPGTHTPHRPTQQKNPGRLPRSATFPLFKRRKMRYTGKEIHPDTEDET